MRRRESGAGISAGHTFADTDVGSLRGAVCGVVKSPEGLLRLTVAAARECLALVLGIDLNQSSDLCAVLDELLQSEAMRTLESRGRDWLRDATVDSARCRACVFCNDKKEASICSVFARRALW